MSEDPFLPRYKDQVASVAAARRPPPNRDPDGMLLASNDATRAVGESSDKAAIQAETEEPPPPNNNNVLDRGSSAVDDRPSPSSATATQIPIAFEVVHAEATPTANSNDSNMVSTANPGNNSNNNGKQADPAHPQTSNTAIKSFPWNTAILAVVVIVGIIVGGVCGSGGCGGTSSEAARETSPVEAGNGDNLSPPTTMTTTISPVTSPTNGAAPTPVSSPVVTTSSRSPDITNFINSKSYTGNDLSPTGNSPEERALQWLIYDDPLQLNVKVDEFRLVQRYSLLTLWFQGGTGTTWISSTNWLTADECTWFGITCQSGVATKVELDQQGLQGSLSPDLGLLTDLTELNFYGNSLSGSLPAEIGLWTNLQRFNATINYLKESLPSQIGLWTMLNVFDLGNNALTGSLPSEIGLWTNLEVFFIYENDLTGAIPATIANWKLIRAAGLNDNNFTGSMPDGICEYITTGTDRLETDCELPCSCCTGCS